MASSCRIPTILSLVFFIFSLHAHSVLSSSNSPSSSPSPAPQPTAGDTMSPVTSISHPPANSPESPSPATGLSSPPAPSPENYPLSPFPSPESDNPFSPSPSTAPSPAADGSAEETNIHDQESPSGGGGKKAGVTIGVLIGACVVGLAGFVYKKRQDNIRRSQYGYVARSSMI